VKRKYAKIRNACSRAADHGQWELDQKDPLPEAACFPSSGQPELGDLTSANGDVALSHATEPSRSSNLGREPALLCQSGGWPAENASGPSTSADVTARASMTSGTNSSAEEASPLESSHTVEAEISYQQYSSDSLRSSEEEYILARKDISQGKVCPMLLV
jgi:hypothetical protein